MRKNISLNWAFIAAGMVVASPPAYAQSSVAKEIVWFHSAQVSLSKSAAKCNLTDPNMFASHLSERLQAIGIARNKNSRIVATLGISATTYGFLSGNCAYNVTFQFQSFLNAEEIVTTDPRIRAALDRLGNLPVSIYQDGVFGSVVLSGTSDEPDSAQKKVKAVIFGLVEGLKLTRRRCPGFKFSLAA